jgi:hypothetical protein
VICKQNQRGVSFTRETKRTLGDRCRHQQVLFSPTALSPERNLSTSFDAFDLSTRTRPRRWAASSRMFLDREHHSRKNYGPRSLVATQRLQTSSPAKSDHFLLRSDTSVRKLGPRVLEGYAFSPLKKCAFRSPAFHMPSISLRI